jgi:NTP pyrophosphatase (non-canonical NTP hydrolase)
MLHTVEKILHLAAHRIQFFHSSEYTLDWYRGSETYIDGIWDEIYEVHKEIRENNHVFLEDELGDVFWNFSCLLASLEKEGKIDASRVFARAYKKYSERVWVDGKRTDSWDIIKKQQLEELQKEHDGIIL